MSTWEPDEKTNLTPEQRQAPRQTATLDLESIRLDVTAALSGGLSPITPKKTEATSQISAVVSGAHNKLAEEMIYDLPDRGVRFGEKVPDRLLDVVKHGIDKAYSDS